MKVKATVNLGRLDYPGLFPFLAGQVREVSDAEAETLIKRGHAVEVPKPTRNETIVKPITHKDS